MKRLTLRVLLALAILSPHMLWAQSGPPLLPIVSLYDLDATTATYCVTAGEQGRVWAPGTVGSARVTTSTTAVAAVTAGDEPFSAVAVGDELEFRNAGVVEYRVVTAVTDADNVTINAALTADLTNVQFRWRDRTCGTGATNGWFPVSGQSFLTVFLQVTQISVTGQIEFKVQCRGSGVDATPIEVYSPLTSNYRTGGYDAAQVDNDAIGIDLRLIQATDCRVGMYIDSADDGSDTGADAEQVTVKVAVR